jgi:4Fe-4S ferredoxin
LVLTAALAATSFRQQHETSRFFTPFAGGRWQACRMPLDSAKARRAARDPDRPGEDCHAAPGVYTITVDRNRCEGKGDCVEVCPHDVFEVRVLDDADFRALSFFGKLKSRAHGKKSAYTPNLGACQACGLCVVACPEDALILRR